MAAFRAAAVARNTSAAAIDRSRPCCSHLRAAVRELASPLVVIGQCAAALPPSQWLLLAASAVGLAVILPAVSISGWQARMLVLASTSSFVGSLVDSWQCAAVLVVICAVNAVALPPSQWLLAVLADTS